MDSKPITEFNTNPMPDDTTDADDDVSNAELREQKLIRMLEESEVLQDIEPRACFLTGVLVGEVSSYQHLYEDRSTTLIDQYSVSAVSKNKIKRLIQNTLDKNFVYSSQNNLGSGMYAEVTDRLTETLTQTDPDEWEIGRDEIRYYYSLGVAYGLNNYVESDNGDEQETEEEPATA